MAPHPYRIASMMLLVGVLAVALPASAQTRQQAPKPEHDHSTHEHTDICAGFVVLPNSYAVLSAMEPASGAGMKHDHGASHGEAGKSHMADTKDAAHQAHMQHGAKAEGSDPLLGYKHGDDIPTGKDMVCVPIGAMTSTSWAAVSASADLQVTATSAKGALAHNSRANESLSLHIMLEGKPVEQGTVRLIARMPHHDRSMAGGHGPANDPEVKGFEAMPQGKGDYTVSTVDFNMGGPWLFEVQVQNGQAMRKAYFATEIGEE